jgi:hypothetical protein
MKKSDEGMLINVKFCFLHIRVDYLMNAVDITDNIQYLVYIRTETEEHIWRGTPEQLGEGVTAKTNKASEKRPTGPSKYYLLVGNDLINRGVKH